MSADSTFFDNKDFAGSDTVFENSQDFEGQSTFFEQKKQQPVRTEPRPFMKTAPRPKNFNQRNVSLTSQQQSQQQQQQQVRQSIQQQGQGQYSVTKMQNVNKEKELLFSSTQPRPGQMKAPETRPYRPLCTKNPAKTNEKRLAQTSSSAQKPEPANQKVSQTNRSAPAQQFNRQPTNQQSATAPNATARNSRGVQQSVPVKTASATASASSNKKFTPARPVQSQQREMVRPPNHRPFTQPSRQRPVPSTTVATAATPQNAVAGTVLPPRPMHPQTRPLSSAVLRTSLQTPVQVTAPQSSQDVPNKNQHEEISTGKGNGTNAASMPTAKNGSGSSFTVAERKPTANRQMFLSATRGTTMEHCQHRTTEQRKSAATSTNVHQSGSKQHRSRPTFAMGQQRSSQWQQQSQFYSQPQVQFSTQSLQSSQLF